MNNSPHCSCFSFLPHAPVTTLDRAADPPLGITGGEIVRHTLAWIRILWLKRGMIWDKCWWREAVPSRWFCISEGSSRSGAPSRSPRGTEWGARSSTLSTCWPVSRLYPQRGDLAGKDQRLGWSEPSRELHALWATTPTPRFEGTSGMARAHMLPVLGKPTR